MGDVKAVPVALVAPFSTALQADVDAAEASIAAKGLATSLRATNAERAGELSSSELESLKGCVAAADKADGSLTRKLLKETKRSLCSLPFLTPKERRGLAQLKLKLPTKSRPLTSEELVVLAIAVNKDANKQSLEARFPGLVAKITAAHMSFLNLKAVETFLDEFKMDLK